jgi:N-acetylmuramoyl-L-alanine amidase
MPHHNSGATGNGLYEHDITFLVGCILADILKADGRFAVELSRPNKSVVLGTDNKSSLMARVEGAAAFEADYLISLHTNSFDQDSANGIEVFASDIDESYPFGNSLLEGMVDSTNLKKRGMRPSSELYVLENTDMPAVLLEMGFISNTKDAALLSEHPELFAQGIYNGIKDYFESAYTSDINILQWMIGVSSACVVISMIIWVIIGCDKICLKVEK